MQLTKEQEVLKQIINEAWENEIFKQELIDNPVTTIEKLTGRKLDLPESKELVVRDQMDENSIYINIPPKQNLEDMELNEEQLDAAAGGSWLGRAIGYVVGGKIAGEKGSEIGAEIGDKLL